MSGFAAAPEVFAGECLFCATHQKRVRLWQAPARGGTTHPPVAACFACRPSEAQPMRRFAVLMRCGLETVPYLIEAPSIEDAHAMIAEEAEDEFAGDDFTVQFRASGEFIWRTAWRRGDVITIRERKLPEGIE